MKWLNRIIAAVMLLVWIPATSLCFVERAGWLVNDDCCPSSSTKSPPDKSDNGSPCCTLASANYKADEDRPSLDAPVVALLFVLDLQESEEFTSPPSQTPSTLPPPELAAGWQFLWRTVSSPRAPSFAS